MSDKQLVIINPALSIKKRKKGRKIMIDIHRKRGGGTIEKAIDREEKQRDRERQETERKIAD